MERLKRSDFKRILEFLENLYAVQDHLSLRKNIVRALPSLIQADVHSYTETNHQENTAILEDAPGGPVMSPTEKECYSQFSLQHPTIAYYQQTGDGQTLKISDFLTSSEWQRTDLYSHVYRPHGLKYNLGAGLALSKEVVMALGLSRGRKDFSERDRSILNLLRPHCLQAYSNARLVTQMQQRMTALTRVVDQLDQAVLEVDAKGNIVWVTDKAKTLLQEIERPSSQKSWELPQSIWSWAQASFNQLTDSDNLPFPFTPLKLETDRSIILIHLTLDGDNALLFFEEQSKALPLERLKQLGLSPRETEILGWIAQGKSNLEIAEILGIRLGTVKTHVERVYVKLGVENRHAAIVLALETVLPS